MVRTGVKVILADAVLLVAGYFVLLDLQWRSAYAASEGLAPSYSYSPFTKFFTLSGRSLPLVSPPTLDWVQVSAALLVVLNVWYLYRILTRRGKGEPGEVFHDVEGFS